MCELAGGWAALCLCGWQAGGGGDDGGIAGVQGRAHEQDRRDAPDDLSDIADLVKMERAAKQGEFAIAEPLLEDLIPAERLLPDGGNADICSFNYECAAIYVNPAIPRLPMLAHRSSDLP